MDSKASNNLILAILGVELLAHKGDKKEHPFRLNAQISETAVDKKIDFIEKFLFFPE